MASLKARGTPERARKRVKNSEPTRMIKIEAVELTAWLMASSSACRVSLRRITEITRAAATPSAPASVGEKMPLKMPPSTQKISAGSGQTSRRAAARSSGVDLIATGPARAGLSQTRTMIIAM